MGMKIKIKKIIISGIEIGHEKEKRNRKIKKYIYGVKEHFDIIDIVKTFKKIKESYNFVKKSRIEGKEIIFVGTKKQARKSIEEFAKQFKSFFVKERWLGGIITNWATVSLSLAKINNLEIEKRKGSWQLLKKKENSILQKRIERLNKYFKE